MRQTTQPTDQRAQLSTTELAAVNALIANLEAASQKRGGLQAATNLSDPFSTVSHAASSASSAVTHGVSDASSAVANAAVADSAVVGDAVSDAAVVATPYVVMATPAVAAGTAVADATSTGSTADAANAAIAVAAIATPEVADATDATAVGTAAQTAVNQTQTDVAASCGQCKSSMNSLAAQMKDRELAPHLTLDNLIELRNHYMTMSSTDVLSA